MVSGAANRDDTVFPDPDRLDIHRDARQQVAFGCGPHACAGQPLARTELRVVNPALLRRGPTPRLATGVEKIPFEHDVFVHGVYELPVAW